MTPIAPVEAVAPAAVDTTSVQIKQEHTAKPQCQKRQKQTELQEGDYVAMKVHKMMRTNGDRKGKLVPKAEGPYLVTGFTDHTKNIADATGNTWIKRVPHLSLWE